jgi:hypothetical protein
MTGLALTHQILKTCSFPPNTLNDVCTQVSPPRAIHRDPTEIQIPREVSKIAQNIF